ncbi:MAG: methylmalonyl-CoA epimerase [Chloroflexi bacterium]|nr:methylmalonyl-CoA epimerase [Chloroflexota bacterium]
MPSVMRIDHIAVVVPDIDDARGFYERLLGLTVADVEQVDEQEVVVAFMPTGDSEIELLEPLNDTSGVARFMEKRGPGIHHICLAVDDIDGMLARLKEAGAQLINEEAVIGAGGRRVAFVHPKASNGVLIELVEEQMPQIQPRISSETVEPERSSPADSVKQTASRFTRESRALAAGVRAFVQALRQPALPRSGGYSNQFYFDQQLHMQSGGITLKAEGEQLILFE